MIGLNFLTLLPVKAERAEMGKKTDMLAEQQRISIGRQAILFSTQRPPLTDLRPFGN